MIRFDRTQRSVVVVCYCGAREVFGSMGPADVWAREHVERAHPEKSPARQQAITASRVRQHRRDTP